MTYEATHNAIRTRLVTVWASRTLIAYDNVAFAPPSDNTLWIRLSILDSDARQAAMGSPGNNMFRHPGLIVVSVFAPLNQGEKLGLQRADEASAVFRGWQDATTRLRCYAPTVSLIGKDETEKWYQFNVSTPFERDTAF